MRICLIVEGSYPYVQGGVSSWVNALITQLPDCEFVIQTIAASREDRGKYKYTLPPNVVEVNESFLQDDDIVERGAKKTPLSKREKDAIRSLVFGEDPQWEALFDLFQSKTVSLNELLMGQDFYNVVWDFYNAKYNRIVFTDFLWTCRSVFLPLFTVMKNRFPKADVYHAVSTGYAGVVAVCAGYVHQKPVILTEHGIYTREREEEIIRASWTRGVYKDLWINYFYMLSQCIYTRATHVFSLFNQARNLQIELGCPEDKTEVIHNGIKFDAFQNLPPKDADDPFTNVGAIVRVTPIKDIKTMISAFHYAKEKVSSLKLYIIGNTDEDPIYYKECVEMIETLGTQDIVFTGHVNVRDYMSRLDIVLLTSISEGQPLSLLEAMAAGIPCISTNVGDCFDMLNAGDEDGCAGSVVTVMNVGQLAQSIVRLAEDPALRRKMGENGRAIVDKSYRDTVFIERYTAVYQALASDASAKVDSQTN